MLGAHCPELALLLSCGRILRRDGLSESTDDLLARSIDWDRFRALTRWHRMVPLVESRFRSQAHLLPPAELDWLRHHAKENAGRVLRLTSELVRVLRLLREAEIQAVPYKGPVLAIQLYGDLALRPAGDLDILVRRADVPRARELLMAEGFTDRYGLSEANTAFRLAHRYSEDLLSPDGIRLDLHWAFSNRDVPFTLTLEALTPRLVAVRMGDQEVPAFSREDLLLILCVHGAKHRWDRLEWICGIGALLGSRGSVDWRRALNLAESLLTRRTLLLGVSLAHDLMDAPVPGEVLRQAREDRWIPRLMRDVHARLDPEEADYSPVGAMLSHNMFQLPLQDRIRDRARFLAYRLTTPNRPTAWRSVPVGKLSIPLHAVTWPALLLWKLLRRPLRRSDRPEVPESGPGDPVKRTVDVIGSVMALTLLAPVLLVTALTVRVGMGSPVLFRQARPGLHGRPFTLLKFRTMRDALGPDGIPLPDAERLTRLGAFLRSTSMDELPGLWNVVRGEMSLVGPRPLLMEYLELYTPEQARRHEVRPGLTGWAQVNGRNALSWSERLAMDVWYVDHRSLGLDLRILLRTMGVVIWRTGVRQEGHATMERFRGSAG